MPDHLFYVPLRHGVKIYQNVQVWADPHRVDYFKYVVASLIITNEHIETIDHKFEANPACHVLGH